MKYVIVGGVAGGASTAARLRRLDENAEIIIFEKGEHVSYANCGLPYYIGDTIKDRDNLFVMTAEQIANRLNVNVRTLSMVKSIDKTLKTVSVLNINSGEEYTESYDKLILSPGASPIVPPIPGIKSDKIFTVRNVPDTDNIKAYIHNNNVKNAVVVGAGFIGLEMAENFHELGINTSIVELSDQILNIVDYEMATIGHKQITDKGVGLHLGDGVKEFVSENEKLSVELNSGIELEADIVILSIGVKPENKLAQDCGIELGSKGGIKVNEYLQTSDKDIYALGDAIEVEHLITNDSVLINLAGPANKQGRICANNLFYGNEYKYNGAIGTGIVKLFDLNIGSTGGSEKILRSNNIPFESVIIHGSSHASYYPGAKPIIVKVHFSPEDGKVLGGQVVGSDGVDKRVDMIASIIKTEGTIYDLIELEHSYAPPFSSAKDPVNVAGLVADNILTGKMKQIKWNEFDKLKGESYILDVRTSMEAELNPIENANNLALDDIRNKLSDIPKDKKVIVICGIGQRAYFATRILLQNGYDAYNLSGGYKIYSSTQGEQSKPLVAKAKEEKIVQNNVINIPIMDLKILNVDACGLQCPGPVMKLKENIDKIENGEVIEITSTDAGFKKDVGAWCNITGNQLLSLNEDNGVITAQVKKQEKTENMVISGGANGKDNKTLIVFSDDLDKALASFVIANGAASTGKKVSMFFTFWGLSVIKDPKVTGVKKGFLGHMFGMMLPKGSKKLTLSKINMFGIGAKMMRWIMKNQKVDSLEQMIQQANKNGIEFIACQMSMDVMGVKKEELFDFVTIGGVASYLERAEDANLNLFI